MSYYIPLSYVIAYIFFELARIPECECDLYAMVILTKRVIFFCTSYV